MEQTRGRPWRSEPSVRRHQCFQRLFAAARHPIQEARALKDHAHLSHLLNVEANVGAGPAAGCKFFDEGVANGRVEVADGSGTQIEDLMTGVNLKQHKQLTQTELS